MPYLSAADYVTRFGSAETIRLTDETKTGTVNVDKVESAISDADQFADSYLGTRYALPIEPVHPILVGIVAALARENLHREKATPAVTEAADRARAQLRDLSAGRAIIPVESPDQAPESLSADQGVTSGDARPRVFSDEALYDFVTLGSAYGRYPINLGTYGRG